MRTVYFALLMIVLLPAIIFADTTWVETGVTTGTWTPMGSPYMIYNGDIEIPDSHTLTIMPGTEVLFTGRYKIIVHGRLMAEGVEGDSIIFTRAYPTEASKWRGILFDGAYDGSHLDYCRIQYVYHDDPDYVDRRGAVRIEYCSPTISHCLICDNKMGEWSRSGAIHLGMYSNSIIENNHITRNWADYYGGAIDIGGWCNPTIRYNRFEFNESVEYGGAIYVSATASPTIHDNIFWGNFCDGSGGALCLWGGYGFYGTRSTVYNNLFVNNTAGCGGAIYDRYDASELYSNTFMDNRATFGTAIRILNQGNYGPTFFNSIIWDSGEPGSNLIDYLQGVHFSLSYSCVKSDETGPGVIHDDPRFVSNGTGEDFYLSQLAAGQSVQSPCVDAGDPGTPMITGTTRTDGVQDEGVVDMGFHANYYYGGVPCSYQITLSCLTTPPWIPAMGGELNYSLTVQSVAYSATIIDLWTEIVFPTGQSFSPVWFQPETPLRSQSIRRWELIQQVPASAPPGIYTYICHSGSYPNSIAVSDSFQFRKLGSGPPPGAGDYNEESGWGLTEVTGRDRNEGAVISAHPNPFNPTTTIRFGLPDAGQVNLNVYNISGQKVADLVDGWRDAGWHEVVFDGINLSSGLYIYRITAAGITRSHKMLLVK